MASTSFLADRQRHSLSPLLTPGSRLVSDKHNGDSMTKCMRIKTPHSVLHLLKQNVLYKYCDSVNTGLPLTPCVCVCVHVVSYRAEAPGAWGAWASGVGHCWPLTQNWRKNNKRLFFLSLQLGVERSLAGLDRRCGVTCS